MFRSVNELLDYKIQAVDGEIGKVDDFFFDDEHWIIRYLVVRTGIWLFGRKVLIAPDALGKPDSSKSLLPVNLTKEQIKTSPDIDTDQPVSRRHEEQLYTFYGWAPYWSAGTLGPYIPPPIPVRASAQTEIKEKEAENHLRSAKEVIGYGIQARDDEIGELKDFIIEDDQWTIRYIVVETSKMILGKSVLLARDWIQQISWADQKIYMDLTATEIENAPEYDSMMPIDRDYEEKLHDYYGRSITV